MTPKQRHLTLAVAGRQHDRIQGREEATLARLAVCGSCPSTQPMQAEMIGQQEVITYRCTGRFCTKPLDLKISMSSEVCPLNKWK